MFLCCTYLFIEYLNFTFFTYYCWRIRNVCVKIHKLASILRVRSLSDIGKNPVIDFSISLIKMMAILLLCLGLVLLNIICDDPLFFRNLNLVIAFLYTYVFTSDLFISLIKVCGLTCLLYSLCIPRTNIYLGFELSRSLITQQHAETRNLQLGYCRRY